MPNNCPTRPVDGDGKQTPCPFGVENPTICFGDHACENLGEQALIQALVEKKDKAKKAK